MDHSPGKTVALLFASWTCFALAIGLAGWFHWASALGVAATVWVLTAVALLLIWKVPSIHQWAMEIDLRVLLSLHLTRLVAGAYFMVLARAGALPGAFAKPAGVGDIVVAVLALWLIFNFHSPRSSTLLTVWNTIGLIDIVFVVFAALRIGLQNWSSMALLRELPLSLLPTLVVPWIIASHVLIFVRLARSRSHL